MNAPITTKGMKTLITTKDTKITKKIDFRFHDLRALRVLRGSRNLRGSNLHILFWERLS